MSSNETLISKGLRRCHQFGGLHVQARSNETLISKGLRPNALFVQLRPASSNETLISKGLRLSNLRTLELIGEFE
jgi:hypothetical protein